jgi:hypothetical protein
VPRLPCRTGATSRRESHRTRLSRNRAPKLISPSTIGMFREPKSLMTAPLYRPARWGREFLTRLTQTDRTGGDPENERANHPSSLENAFVYRPS